MKKRLFFLVICLALLLVGCEKKESSYKITLDINPSIEIEIQNEKVKSITALNDDADNIVNKKMEGRLLESALEDILKKSKDKGYLDGDTLNVILGVEENDDGAAEEALREASKDSKVSVNIIIPDINKEAIKKAEEYKITAAKAGYLLGIIKFNDSLKFEDLIDKSIRELIEMKQTGLSCEEGYTLNDGYCEKPIKEEEPEKGKTCPEGYQKVKDNCYMVSVIKHEPTCSDGYELKDGKCIGTERVAARHSCSSGVYNESTGVCDYLEYVGPALEVMDGDDVKQTCSSGVLTTGSKGKGCYENKTSIPTYTCSVGTLDGNECVVESNSKEPTLSVVCDKGLTKYKDLACLDYKKTADFVTGYTCKNGARLEGEKCVYYEVIAAKSK